MIHSDRQTQVERWVTRFGWGGIVFGILFLTLFFVANAAGVGRFFSWFSDGLALIPEAIQRITTHYSSIPAAQWLPSVGIGAAMGVVSSLWMLKRRILWQIALGGLIGASAGQILTLTTQHCTYATDAEPVGAVIGIVLTLLGSLLGLVPYWTALRQRVGKNDFVAGYFRNRWLPYLLLTPMLINLSVFLYYPSLQTMTLSLFNKRFPLPQERFVCLNNYTSLVGDVIYQNSFLTTLLLTSLIVVTSISLSLAIALLASQKIRYASVYRTLLIWPFALSPVVAGAIFLTMFRDGQTGLINALVYALTGTTLSWLRDVDLARLAIVVASVWNILGFNVLFYISGLQNVPTDVLEAADIDGANRWQRFWRITFPLLAPFSFFLLVTNVTYSFYGIYGVIDTLTLGGPPLGAAGSQGGATDVLIYKLYEDAFTPGSPIGLAAAQAVILFIMVAGITILQFRTLESRITYGE